MKIFLILLTIVMSFNLFAGPLAELYSQGGTTDEMELQQFKSVFDKDISKDLLKDLIEKIDLGKVKQQESGSYTIEKNFYAERIFYMQFKNGTICKASLSLGICGDGYCSSRYGTHAYASCRLNGETTTFHANTIKMNTITSDRSQWTVD